jgi:hypothetical protein
MSTVTETEVTPKERITAWAERHGVTMRAEFVPFSQSRNRGEKSPSLNWRVTLERNGCDILTTDYSAGCGHCPGYGPQYGADSYAKNRETRARVAHECETGRKCGKYYGNIGYTQKGAAILPDLDSVLWSLSMDSSVLDAGGFESWADEFGYDADSRAAEAIYRACIDTALKMRAALGDAAMAELAEAGQDY